MEASPFGAFNEWLDQVEHVLDAEGRSSALLALDEFEALESLPDKGRFDEIDLLRLLRNCPAPSALQSAARGITHAR